MKQTWIRIEPQTRAQVARFLRVWAFIITPPLLAWLVGAVGKMEGWYVVPLGIISAGLETAWRIFFPAQPERRIKE